jgi:hypothetical protein
MKPYHRSFERRIFVRFANAMAQLNAAIAITQVMAFAGS